MKYVLTSGKKTIFLFQLSLRFTSEVVTDCVLGLQTQSFSSKSSPIKDMIMKIFEQNWIFIVYTLVLGLFPSISNWYKIRFFPKQCEEFFLKVVQDAINLRKEQLAKGINANRIDFLNYMLQLQEKKNLPTMDLTAHTMTFLSDGFETTTAVLSHTLLFVSLNLQIFLKLI